MMTIWLRPAAAPSDLWFPKRRHLSNFEIASYGKNSDFATKNDKITKNVTLLLDFLEFGITVSLRTPRNPFPDSRNTKTTLVKQT